MGRRILIVEDDRATAALLQRALLKIPGLVVETAASFKETREVVNLVKPEDFFVALVDLQLPDAPPGTALDYLLGRGIPCIVFTGDFSDEVREEMVAKRVVDYLLKEDAASVNAVVRLVERLFRNESVVILVVDDSRTARVYFTRLLKRHRFQVLEADSGESALGMLDRHPEISLVITDYHMPGMDGAELTRRVREKTGLNQVAIIGVSAQGSTLLSARFLKNGANDFITKPFLEEEFYCRVNLNVSLMETMRALQDASIRDSLTGLHNRRYFNEVGRQVFAVMQRKQAQMALGMIDLDFFKRVNDSFGHEAGDEVLCAVAAALKLCVRESDLLCRLGGEEFCIMATNLDPGMALKFFERVRASIANLEFNFQGEPLRMTTSIGVCTQVPESLSHMLNTADTLLYQAKSAGRNQVASDAETALMGPA